MYDINTEIFFDNGESVFINYESGQFAVYDCFEWSMYYPDVKPRYKGTFDGALEYIEKCRIEIAEDMLF